MAAPVVTARNTPSGFKMPDGYQTLIAFQINPAIQLWEVEVKPAGLDGGDKIDTTTMHNKKWRTYAARHLKTVSDGSMMCAYDPDVWNGLLELVNREQSITVHYPDNSALAFFGFLQKVEQVEHREGEMPKLTCTITPTNWDPVNFVEADPVFQPASGT